MTKFQTKSDDLDKKLTQMKEQLFQLEKTKEQAQIEAEARIVFLNQKLLTNLG